MKNPFFLFLIINLLVSNLLGQDESSLKVGDTAPGLVLNSTNNSIQSFSFPYQNRITLLFFWSSSVSKSKENIYKYKRLYSKYSDIGYKTSDGFDMISVALQSDKNVWAQDLEKYSLLNINNCISVKGYNDMFVKNYKIKSTPSSFLIDETGKIVAINPSIKTIIEHLDSKRNVELNTEIQTKLSGKIMIGYGALQPLMNEKIWFLNGKDTLNSTILDDKGSFYIENINTLLNLNVFIKANNKVLQEQTLFLTSQNGEIISEFSQTGSGFEYSILDVEIPYLRPFSENKNPVKVEDKSVKNLYTIEYLFSSKEVILSKAAIQKLNAIVVKLKENPKTTLEIISHTDSNGDTKANQSLTLKQSNIIAKYLISKGINKNRIKSMGKGEDELLNTCKDGTKCSELEHKENRRTEFKFFSL
jgi:outer membrane protein OmpA-like peptidoglycan-associated protein